MNEREILLYDLGVRPASFDFVTCLSTAIGQGCKHVRFVYGQWKKKDYTVKQAEERWRSIVEPASALFGVDYSIGVRVGVEVNHMIYAAINSYKKTGLTGKITTPCASKGYVTVTLRKSRNPARDSKEVEWRKFSERCDRKVIFLKDNEDSSLGLHDRMKLYAGAYLNMGVMNGPMTLCFHSDAPYLTFRTIGGDDCGSTSPAFSKGNGITPGFQFPWASANQRLGYMDDTCENIEAEYRAMCRVIDERKAA